MTDAKSRTTPQFAGQAKELYLRLSEAPGQLPEVLRWQLRELRARKSKSGPTTQECLATVSELLATPSARQLNTQETAQLLRKRPSRFATGNVRRRRGPIGHVAAGKSACSSGGDCPVSRLHRGAGIQRVSTSATESHRQAADELSKRSGADSSRR